jgi:hypothetical protein
MSEKLIADALGLRPLDEVREEEHINLPEILDEDETALVPASELNDEVIDDIEFAKNNIRNLVVKGGDSLDTLLQLASSSESPRAFEVVSTMMKTLVDANKEYVQMSEKKKYAKEDHPATTQNNVTNNNLIVSTADLLKMIKGDT